ncbi:hypothetical protein BV22DRAFT_1110357 [Leucogyrophana mollusca]|uniref:Uncharacterized protein n=1 Tax=Leucogyrophana mollusca TaxID=85980 RepID=A0ACB8BRM0_9AGAM|nr:hypothetical protein BV22DRAFT_1110357 [Leucogyrophana mollusca]
MRTEQTLLSLPLELLCHILGELDAYDLVSIRMICKVLKEAIDGSEALQYILDLRYYQTIAVDSTEKELPVAARRTQLKQREAAWHKLQYRSRCDLPLPAMGPIYEFVDGIYGNYVQGKIHFVQLPSIEQPKAGSSWTHLAFEWNLVDITFSPPQDLLAIVAIAADGQEHPYDIHLRTLSSNEPHPLAAVTVLQALDRDHVAPVISEPGGPVKIQVVGDYIGLLCRDIMVEGDSVGAYLQVWDWKSKNGYQFILQFQDGADDFSFLSDDTFLLLTVDGGIELHSFQDLRQPPQVTGRYALPGLMKDWVYSYAFMSGNPTPGSTFPFFDGAPYRPPQIFHPRMEDQLLVFFVAVSRESNEADTHSFVFFIHRSTLFNLQKIVHQHNPDLDVTKAPVPWPAWGPNYTRWFTQRETTDWQHSIYGHRTIETINDDPSYLSQEPRKLRIRDFNPHLARGHRSESGEGDWGRTIVSAPTTTLRRPFVEPLGSGLPYRETISKEKFDVTEAMMDGCRILLLRRDATRIRDSVEVLMF